MRQGIHPVLNPVVFIDAATGDEIVTRSAAKSRETRDIEGVTHFVIKCDISCFSHPFYTGTQRLVDAEGRVDRFRRKYKRAQQKEE